MPLIDVQNISYGYSRDTPFEVTALDNVSFSVEKGEFIGVIGHTGSGKSTLMQMLNGLLRPDTGKVLIDGKDINSDKNAAKSARFRVGLCFQYPEYQLFEETCARDISFGPRNMKLSEKEIAERVKLAAGFVGLDESLLEVSPFELSGGQKRRCAIAGVMAMLPEILILDEPVAGLDPSGRDDIYTMINNYRNKTGAAVMIVSHSMEDVAVMAHRILVLNGGKLSFDGAPQEVFSHSDELISMGLDVPFATRVLSSLKSSGLDISNGVYTSAGAVSVLADYALKRRKK